MGGVGSVGSGFAGGLSQTAIGRAGYVDRQKYDKSRNFGVGE